ncbi:c-type cytochrome [Heliomicrobium modesticaldum]|nr:c-type cytochrome [Heliomicrobium modesticaldum]
MGTRKFVMFGSTGLLLAGILLAPTWQAQGELVRGHELYKTHCASCHGEDGKGVQGVKAATLNNEGFLKVASDDYLLKSIRLGRPSLATNAMPHFDTQKLPDEKVNLIIKNMRSWHPEISAPVETGEKVAGDPVKGEAFYKTACAACHGQKGEGGIGAALLDPGYLNSASDEFILQSIIMGRPGTNMPPYPDSPDIRNVVAFLRSKQVPYDPAEKKEEGKAKSKDTGAADGDKKQ